MSRMKNVSGVHKGRTVHIKVPKAKIVHEKAPKAPKMPAPPKLNMPKAIKPSHGVAGTSQAHHAGLVNKAVKVPRPTGAKLPGVLHGNAKPHAFPTGNSNIPNAAPGGVNPQGGIATAFET